MGNLISKFRAGANFNDHKEEKRISAVKTKVTYPMIDFGFCCTALYQLMG
jgi:hypothetical protein